MHFFGISNLMIFVFTIGYLAIIFEYYLKVNKTAIALITAVLTWAILFVGNKANISFNVLDIHVGHASQIIFFLLGAVTLVELIDSHRGFKIITDLIHTKSKKKMLWFVGIFAFFLSAVLDNLTTTIILVSVLRKIIKVPKDRMVLGAVIVICSNAGGAWTPIGDVTTTMLWIKGHLTALGVIKALFIPSFCSMLITLFLLSFKVKGNFENLKGEKEKIEPGAKIVFFIGVLALVFVPIIRGFTNLPPFMSILIGLGILWLITDLMHYKYETRLHLRVPYVFTKIDVAGILFFLGILLCISSLEEIGFLNNVAVFLDTHIKDTAVIATFLGFLSSIVDNVPLVAACTGMYNFPIDSSFWQMIAYAAGTGGSILVIGSAAGVALMGIEKINFIWYFKNITFFAIIGYLFGMGIYLFIHLF